MRLWPSGTPLQPVISALFALLERETIDPAGVDRVVISVPPHVHRAHARFGVPNGTFVALLSIPYVASVILHDRAAWVPQFAADRYRDPELARFIEERVELCADEAIDVDGARVEIIDRVGTRHEAAVDVARGHPRDPISQAELEAKVRRCADDVIGKTATQELIERVMAVEAETDLGAILGLVRAEHAGA